MHFLADFREGGGVFAGFEGAVLVVGDVHHFLLLHTARGDGGGKMSSTMSGVAITR